MAFAEAVVAGHFGKAFAVADGPTFTRHATLATTIAPENLRPAVRKILFARHEGGHAVVAHLVGMPVESVSIATDDDLFCQVGLTGSYEDSLAICAAGSVGERFIPESGKLLSNVPDVMLEVEDVALANQLGRPERITRHSGEWKEASERVRDMLCRHVRFWEAVVNALLERGTLDGDELAEIADGLRVKFGCEQVEP